MHPSELASLQIRQIESINVDLLDVNPTSTEITPDGLSLKYVFESEAPNRRGLSRLATYETGSYLDNGGRWGEPTQHDICVSTAGGCTRNCTFCGVPSATLGFQRLLTSSEITHQIIYAAQQRNPGHDYPNVVGFMGNGEPLDNALNLAAAVRQLANPLSTLNPPPIAKFIFSTIGRNTHGLELLTNAFTGLAIPVHLQFSLHTAIDTKRNFIIPDHRPLSDIMHDVDRYARQTGFEARLNIALMQGPNGFTNASPEDAQALADLVMSPSFHDNEPIHRRVKISSYNSIPGLPFQPVDQHTKQTFIQTLSACGIEDIFFFQGSATEITANGTGGFACGQLRTTTSKQ